MSFCSVKPGKNQMRKRELEERQLGERATSAEPRRSDNNRLVLLEQRSCHGIFPPFSLGQNTLI